MAEDLLKRIDAKLGAILTLMLDSYLRESKVARPRPRSVDRMLRDAGLGTQEIALVVGKSQRAVELMLEKGN